MTQKQDLEPDCFIYFLPSCSKSQAALKQVRASGHSYTLYLYAEEGLTRSQLESLLKDIPGSALIRQKDVTQFDQHSLNLDDPESIIKCLSEDPILLQRPIIQTRHKSIIARDPEQVDLFLKSLSFKNL